MRIESCNSEEEAKQILRLEYIPQPLVDLFFEYANQNLDRQYTWILLSDYYIKFNNLTMAKKSLKNAFLIAKQNNVSPGVRAYANAYQISVLRNESKNAWNALQHLKKALDQKHIPYDFSFDESLLCTLLFLKEQQKLIEPKITASPYIGTVDTSKNPTYREVKKNFDIMAQALTEFNFPKMRYYLRECKEICNLQFYPSYCAMVDELLDTIQNHYDTVKATFRREKEVALIDQNNARYLACIQKEHHCYPNDYRSLLQDCDQLLNNMNIHLSNQVLNYLQQTTSDKSIKDVIRYLNNKAIYILERAVQNKEMKTKIKSIEDSIEKAWEANLLDEANRLCEQGYQETGEIKFLLFLAENYKRKAEDQKQVDKLLIDYIKQGGIDYYRVVQLGVIGRFKGHIPNRIWKFLIEATHVENYLQRGDHFSKVLTNANNTDMFSPYIKPSGEYLSNDFAYWSNGKPYKEFHPSQHKVKKYDKLLNQLKKEQAKKQ